MSRSTVGNTLTLPQEEGSDGRVEPCTPEVNVIYGGHHLRGEVLRRQPHFHLLLRRLAGLFPGGVGDLDPGRGGLAGPQAARVGALRHDAVARVVLRCFALQCMQRALKGCREADVSICNRDAIRLWDVCLIAGCMLRASWGLPIASCVII